MNSNSDLPRAFRDKFAVVDYCSEHSMSMWEGGHQIVLEPQEGGKVTYYRSSNPRTPGAWERE